MFRVFVFISQIQRFFVGLIRFVILIKFKVTKQIVVTFIATAFKTLLSVTGTNGTLSGREFYAGNIYHLFGNILTHTFTSSA